MLSQNMRLFYILLTVIVLVELSESLKPSLMDPPWKHCVHRMQAKKSWQVIMSPGFPHGIRTQTQCSWIISALPSKKVKVAFQTLNLTGSINNCYTQFVEYWEIKSGSSMGRFCGDRRPGDFVTYGNQIRVDLKADTAAAGHEGFMLKYRITKESGGFKETHSFAKTKPKKNAKQSNAKKVSSTISKDPDSEKSSPPLNNGGRVNLAERQKQREKLLKKKGSISKDNSNKQAPVRTIQSAGIRPPSFQDNEIKVSLRDGDEVALQLWIIILIGVGGFLFLVLVAVVGWICICRKRGKNKTNNNPTTACSPASSLLKDKSPLDTMTHPIHRRHELPGAETYADPVQNCVSREVILRSHQVVEHAPPNRASQKNVFGRFDSRKKEREENDNMGFCEDAYKPIGSGFLYCRPTTSRRLSGAMSSSTDDGYDTPTALRQPPMQNRKKKVPTLKREISQWEKSQR